MSLRPTLELVQIVQAGGGIDIDASRRPTLELVQIAHAAASSGAGVVFRGLQLRPTLELVQIAHAGKGRVCLAD